MNAEIILIITLSIILLISPFISTALKLPISMVEILLGSIASALGLLYENELFKLLAEVGFLYLMLLAGMEVNLKELFQMDKSLLLLNQFPQSYIYKNHASSEYPGIISPQFLFELMTVNLLTEIPPQQSYNW